MNSAIPGAIIRRLGPAAAVIVLAFLAGLNSEASINPARTYRIDIIHTVDQIAIAFPGGSNNMLTLPATPLGPESAVSVSFETVHTYAWHFPE